MFRELLKKVAGSLSKRGIPYMVIGGQAMLFYGEPRGAQFRALTDKVGKS